MKKKGFTLVELLAVIAILAILVIVAMPNVLGMFNQAKSSTFITEVQEYMSTATSQFMQDALLSQGTSLYYSSSATEVTLNNGKKVKPVQLDMSGGKKDYFIEMDRNGNFKRVVVMDSNYCYDTNYATVSNRATDKTGSALTVTIEKTAVNAAGVWEIDDVNHKIDPTASGDLVTVTGCGGTAKILAQPE